ncbi:putative glutaredoxin-C4 [Amylocarpus encephaloides]|uniref:Glutaredoxin-C4 n=1 Tax=Amylocarpus encephaloides TaxID=45428 RepID=A0A9P7YRP6_9HELO|nr:putative glutaredoxin-C4 [Amylocarpus encephaloides]
MPSTRRIKIFGLLVVICVVTVLYYTSALRQQRPRDLRTAGDFYSKTINALPKDLKQETAAEENVKVKTQQSLKDAAKLAKEKANAKAPKPDAPSEVEGVGSSAEGSRERGVAGRKKIPTKEAQEPLKEETMEEHEVETELNSILKKSPVIIFSKSYCPHSKKAKAILLEKYIIDPAPYVVELDQHKLGAALQNKLAELTERRTVPNVLINAISIGGGDDIEAMDSKRTLIRKIKDLGQKKVIDMRERPTEDTEEEPATGPPSHGL